MTDKPRQALEAPCRHEWYQRECVHCGIAVSDFRAALAATPTHRSHDMTDKLREALAFYADDANWRQNGPLDPNSANFTGGPARAALAAMARRQIDQLREGAA